MKNESPGENDVLEARLGQRARETPAVTVRGFPVHQQRHPISEGERAAAGHPMKYAHRRVRDSHRAAARCENAAMSVYYLSSKLLKSTVIARFTRNGG